MAKSAIFIEKNGLVRLQESTYIFAIRWRWYPREGGSGVECYPRRMINCCQVLPSDVIYILRKRLMLASVLIWVVWCHRSVTEFFRISCWTSHLISNRTQDFCNSDFLMTIVFMDENFSSARDL